MSAITPLQDAIYEIDGSRVPYSKVAQILSLARVGAASTDTNANIDLAKFGHCGVFEVIASLADGLLDDIEHLERELAKAHKCAA